MRDWPTAAAGWFRRIFQQVTNARRAPDAEGAGIPTVTTGGSAVVAVEAQICDAVCRPRGSAAGHTGDEAVNAYGRIVQDFRADGARAVMAGACGLAMTGARTAAFLPGDRLAEIHDQLFAAVGRHLPLVVHASNRAMPRQTSARGSGHEGYHAVADCGAFLAMPRNAQEAVDVTLAARWLTERALIPGIVAMDGPETTWAPQDLLVPDPTTFPALVRTPGQEIDASTEAQRMVFGGARRLVPRWMSSERPVALGVAQDVEDFGVAVAGHREFFAGPLRTLAAQARSTISEYTGRKLEAVSWHGPREASHVFVAQGSLAEAACAAADTLGQERGDKVAALSVVWLRPFPADEIAVALSKAETVTVLERVDDALAGAPPLTREIAPLLRGTDVHVQSATWGIGGHPVETGDLVWLGQQLRDGQRFDEPFFLGLAGPGTDTTFPRREARTTAVARSFPNLARTWRGTDEVFTEQPGASRSVLLVVPEEDATDDLAVALAGAAAGDELPHARGRVVIDSEGLWNGHVSVSEADAVRGLHAQFVDVFLLNAPDLPPNRDAFERVVREGLVVLGGAFGDDPWAALHPVWRDSIIERRLRLTRIAGDTDSLIAGFGDLVAHGLESAERVAVPNRNTDSAGADRDLPFIVRRIQRNDTDYDNPARIWGEVVQPRAAGESSPQGPDPYITVGTVPPGTSTFHDGSAGRDRLPVIDTAACTGCGRCWTVCPDSALAPIVIGTHALLDAAAERAGTSGPAADRLRRGHKHLAGRVDKIVSSADAPVGPTDAFTTAYEWLVPQLGAPDDELGDLRAAFDATLSAVSPLPMSVTEPFFRTPHRAAKGTGAMLGIALNPQACKGCGGCAEVCADDAIGITPQTADLVAAARSGWSVWEDLPDPSGDVVARAEPEVGRLAAALLSRHCSMAVAGGDAAEPGSGARLAIRLVLAAAEQTLQRRHTRIDEHLGKVESSLRTAIRDSVVSAVNVDDLGALTDGLESAADGVENLESVVQRLTTAGATVAVDAGRLKTLARLATAVERARWRLTVGPNGLGRARLALVIGEGSETDWAVRFPYNPFSAPVSAAMAEDAAELAAGVQAGMLDDAVSLARLVAHAQTALDNPPDLASRAAANERIGWSSVPAELAEAATSVLLIGGTGALAGRGLAALTALLRSELPVRVLLLDECEPGIEAPDPTQIAMLQPNAFAASTSVADPDHFIEAVQRAFQHDGPSLIHVHAPSPRRHGFPKERTVAQAHLTMSTRVHPLAIYDPARGGVFGSRLEVSDNPEAEAFWATDGAGEPMTAWRWLRTESRFAEELDPVEGSTVPLAKWLECSEQERRGTRPTVATSGGSEVQLSEALTRFVNLRAHRWAMLREVAGVETPFTEDVRAQADADMATAHAAEIAALKKDHEAALAELSAGQQARHAADLRDRLLQLAGYAPGKTDGGAGPESGATS